MTLVRIKQSESADYNTCVKLLKDLLKAPEAPKFMNNKDSPNGLLQIGHKLEKGRYSSAYNFVMDIRGLWNYSWGNNSCGSEIYLATTKISNEFEKLLKVYGSSLWKPYRNSIPLKKPAEKKVEKSNDLYKHPMKYKKLIKSRKIIKEKPIILPKKEVEESNEHKDPVKDMPLEEKAKLRRDIMDLPADKLLGIIPIIRGTIDVDDTTNGLEFDINALPLHICWELDAYVKNCKPIEEPKTDNVKLIEQDSISDFSISSESSKG